MPNPDAVNHFWFNELEREDWFARSDALDQQIANRFTHVHACAARGELSGWRASIKGRLAEIIVLDQFSRNLFRDSPLAFATDPMALVLSQEALKVPERNQLNDDEKSFLYLPFMHSESAVIHEQALALFSAPGLAQNLSFELAHKQIIDRFGRYPHRNQVLGRESTAEELEFLKKEGSSF
ncbi:MAG: DUF924 family protein [Gammaproteobacteria bacterium]|nr:DUF924 family protein [Gammaproteobacteria bacterium]